MTTESKTLASVGAIIYESPDGGKTIYAREHGSSHRTLVRTDNAVLEMQQALKTRDKLLDMIMLSKTVPALKEQLDKLEMLYRLVKDENN